MSTQRQNLRAVAADEKAVLPAKPKTVSEAASSGTTRELLVAMRDRVAKDVQNENTAARDLAALTKRLMELVRDIEAVDARAAQEVSEGGAKVSDGVFDPKAV